MRTYSDKIKTLKPNQIFVCGTNTQGRSGKGAALWAVKNAGLKYGHVKGLCGNTFAIVTKDLTKTTHPSVESDVIVRQINDLYQYAFQNPDKEFLVAYSGKGTNLNGYTPEEMALLFVVHEVIPDNIVFEEEFLKLIIKHNEDMFRHGWDNMRDEKRRTELF